MWGEKIQTFRKKTNIYPLVLFLFIPSKKLEPRGKCQNSRFSCNLLQRRIVASRSARSGSFPRRSLASRNKYIKAAEEHVE